MFSESDGTQRRTAVRLYMPKNVVNQDCFSKPEKNCITFCDDSQNGKTFAMTLCDNSQNSKSFAMTLCDNSQSDKAFAMALCDINKSFMQFFVLKTEHHSFYFLLYFPFNRRHCCIFAPNKWKYEDSGNHAQRVIR